MKTSAADETRAGRLEPSLHLGAAEARAFELVHAPMWLMDRVELRPVWVNRSAANLLTGEPSGPRAAVELDPARARWLAGIAERARDLELGDVLHLEWPGVPGRPETRLDLTVRLLASDFLPGPGLLVEAAACPALDDEGARRAVDFLSTMPSAAAIFDLDGSPIWENGAAVRMFASKGGARPKLSERIANPAAASRLLEDLRQGRKVRAEFELVTARGCRWSLLDGRLGVDSATGGHALIVGCSDIHRWKCAELDLREAKELAENASRTKSEFLANMSHEIRTPMNGVLGAIELLGHSPLDDRQRRLVGTVARSARTLLTILDDVLDLSRIEAGKLRLEQIEFNPAETLLDVVSLHEQNAKRKKLELEAHVDPDVPEVLLGDPVRLSQVLGNLLSNAIKFTDEGHVSMRCRLDGTERAWVRLNVEVADTGCGIDEAEQARIFHAFEQADGSVTRRFGGTGLGLAISRQITALMGGKMGVRSALGEGSRFWFTVRLARPVRELEPLPPPVDRPAAVEPPAFASAHPRRERPLRVLLVEDNLVNQEVALAMLEMLECEVECAADGAQALVALTQGSYDLVLMDCQMPVLDGLTAAELIREQESPGSKRLPIIALTANAMAGDRERCLAAGMDDFLAKPFTLDDLANALERWGTTPEDSVDADPQV